MPIPNLLPVLTARTRNFPEIMALTQGRITAGRLRTYSAEDPSGWKMPAYAIVYYTAPGPVFRSSGVPFRGQPVQVECFGPDLRTSYLLWSTWYSCFFPADPFTAQGFIMNNCAVSSIEESGGPHSLFQGQTDWPRTVSTIFVKYSEVPTNVVAGSASLAATAESV